MLEAKFKLLLNGLERYVSKSVEVRGKINDLQQNGVKIYSHEKIENDVKALKAELKNYSEGERVKAEGIVAEIKEELRNTTSAFNVADLQGVFAYLQAAGKEASVDIVEGQLQPFRANSQALTAIAQAAKNNGASEGVKRIIRAYMFDPDAVEQNLMNAILRVYNGGASATDSAKTICKIAKTCGADITTDIKDEYTDNELLRKAFGLF